MIRVVPAALSLVRPGFRAGVAAALALALADVSTTSHAEVAVKGPIDRMQVEARNSSIAEILSALGEVFDLRYRTSVDLNRPVTGTFHGPVLRVISRLLTDYDYVVKSLTADQIEVTIIKFSGRDSDRVIASTASTGGGPYPHPLWRARSYTRSHQPKPLPGQ